MTRSVFNHRRQPPTRSLLFYDDFNRTNNSSVLGASVGSGSLAPLSWTNQIGTWGVSSNKAAVTTTSGGVDVATVPIGIADVYITMTLATTGPTVAEGICFRLQDASNFLMLRQNGSNMQLEKKSAGSFSQITAVAQSFTGGDTISVYANGSSIIGYYNGVQVLSVTDSSFQTQTIHGLTAAGNNSIADDWKCETA